MGWVTLGGDYPIRALFLTGQHWPRLATRIDPAHLPRAMNMRYVGGPLDGRIVPKPAGEFIAVEVIDPGYCKPRPKRCTVRRHVYLPETIDGETILRYSHEK